MRGLIYLAVTLCAALLFAADSGEYEQAPLALGGACPVCLLDAGHVSRGKPEIDTTYKGYTYRFPGQNPKARFLKHPERYAIRMNGYSPVSRANGREEKGDPSVYAVFNGRIYIFTDAGQRNEFLRNPERYAGVHSAKRASSSGRD